MPRDYLPVDLVRRVREAAGYRCGYCLSPQRLVMARLEVEHVIPVAWRAAAAMMSRISG